MNTITQSQSVVPPPASDVEKKIVILLNEDLPRGAAANRCAVLATGLAARHPEILGRDLVTADGQTLPGFTKQPIVVLAASAGQDLNDLASQAKLMGCTTLVFLSRAQGMRSYDAYAESVAGTPAAGLDTDACLIFGPKKAVNKLSGAMPSLK